jgi:hypothetical protein
VREPAPAGRKLTGVRTKASKKNPDGVIRHGLYKCYHCRGQFTVRKGTIFEETQLPMQVWLQVIHLMNSSKKGLATRQVQRLLNCSMETAWVPDASRARDDEAER